MIFVGIPQGICTNLAISELQVLLIIAAVRSHIPESKPAFLALM
jgi:hypothetical protein